jgi:hypothetical protein
MNERRYCVAVGGNDVQKLITIDRLQKDLRPECFAWLALGEVAVLGWQSEEGRHGYFSIVIHEPLHIWEVPFETPGSDDDGRLT